MSAQYPQLTADDIDIITRFFQFVDADSDGFITIAEIREACAVDLDGDGTVSESEKDACSAPWINGYLTSEDTDGDRRITLAELLQYNNDTKSS